MEIQWLLGKLVFSTLWLFNYFHILSIHNAIQNPEGLFRFYSFDLIFGNSLGKITLTIVLSISILLYLFEKWMPVCTFLLSAISILCISYQDSMGIFLRNTHFAGIFSAQFIAYMLAYVLPGFKIKENRYLYTLQIIASIYFLSAIAKIEDSGLGWFLNSDNFLLQIYKNHFFLYANDLLNQHLDFALSLVQFFSRFDFLLKALLGSALLLEFFAFLMLISKPLRYIIAIGLVLMHVGIAVFMGIGISNIAGSLIAWILNPLFLIYILIQQRNSSISHLVPSK